MRIFSEKITKLVLALFVMLICLTILGLILTGINHFKVGSQFTGINQVSNLSHLLVRQQAKLFSLMFVGNIKNEELVDALNTFTKEQFVVDATLYAGNGVVIAKSHHAISFPQQEPILNNTQQIVEPIFVRQELAGFLRVTFDSQYAQTTQDKVNKLFYLLYGELVILFLTGGLFVSCFYAWRRKKAPLVVSKSIQEIHNKLTQTKRFHSRRRAFQRK